MNSLPKDDVDYMRGLLQPFKHSYFFLKRAQMDIRVVLVLAPVLIAASWAGFNIFRAALGQVQDLLNKNNAA